MKIRPVGAELFSVDGQTDRRMDVQTWRGEAGSRFSQFCEPAKMRLKRF